MWWCSQSSAAEGAWVMWMLLDVSKSRSVERCQDVNLHILRLLACRIV